MTKPKLHLAAALLLLACGESALLGRPRRLPFARLLGLPSQAGADGGVRPPATCRLAAAAQEERRPPPPPRDVCMPLPLPSEEQNRAWNNGVTHPELLHSLVKAREGLFSAGRELWLDLQPPPPRCRLMLLPRRPPARSSVPTRRTPPQEVDAVRLFPDSKTIVDMPLAARPEEVIAAFRALALPADPAARNDTLRQFVEEASAAGGAALPQLSAPAASARPV